MLLHECPNQHEWRQWNVMHVYPKNYQQVQSAPEALKLSNGIVSLTIAVAL